MENSLGKPYGLLLVSRKQFLPITKEQYLYRRIFERHFPSSAAAATVPGGPSIACSTPEALAWDEGFATMADPSGRAMRGVHQNSY